MRTIDNVLITLKLEQTQSSDSWPPVSLDNASRRPRVSLVMVAAVDVKLATIVLAVDPQ